MTEEFTFGETRFGDVLTRDEYLQFMYERLILIRVRLPEFKTPLREEAAQAHAPPL